MKEFIKSAWQHKIISLIFIALILLCWKMFVSNYEFQQPVISRRSETYTQVWNSRALLQAQVDSLTAARDAANADIMNDNLK